MSQTDWFLPKIFKMAGLFGPPDSAGTKPVGFRRGSTVLISGSPGSGKTVVALGLARALMTEPDLRDYDLFYISPEVTRDVLQKQFTEFGWFADGDPVFAYGRRVFVPDVPVARVDRPVLSTDEMVNLVFSQIKELRRGRTGRDAFVVVDSLTALLRDSPTGERRRQTHEFIHRLRTAFTDRHTTLGDRLALALLTAETPAVPPTEVVAEEYVADFVFKLKLSDTGSGRRLRTWEVTKSHGAYTALGQHTWAMISEKTSPFVIFDDSLRGFIKDLAQFPQMRTGDKPLTDPDRRNQFEAGWEVLTGPLSESGLESLDEAWRDKWNKVKGGLDGGGDWGAVVVFPRAGAQLLPVRTSPAGTSAVPAKRWSGIPGLDEMLLGDSEYWTRADKWLATDLQQPIWQPGLFERSTTLLLGPSGTGKTIMCFQFLIANADVEFQQLHRESKRGGQKLADMTINRIRELPVMDKIREKLGRTLYVNFENKPDRIAQYAKVVSVLSALLIEDIHQLYFRRANLDVNKFLAHLIWVIRHYKIDRVAIDGLSDLLATTEKTEYSRLVETLLESIRDARRAPVTTLVTFEMPPNFEVIPPSDGLSVTADNVVVLRSLPINDELRKTAFVLKARGLSHDRQVREIVVDQEYSQELAPPLRVQGGLESYTNLLAGKPEPITVVLQLFHENSAQAKYNAELVRRLRRMFGYTFRTYEFTRPEMSRTLEDADAPAGRIPRSDVKILSLDEWWIRELDQPGAGQPLLRLDPFYPKAAGGVTPAHTASPSEHWVTEIEKATSVVRDDQGGKADVRLLAVPNYTDFGLFCVNLTKAQSLKDAHAENWEKWLSRIPRVWAEPNGEGWFKKPDAKDHKDTVVTYLYWATQKLSGQQRWGFTFDMETAETVTCMVLEMSWGFGAPEDFLTRNARDDRLKEDQNGSKGYLDGLEFTAAVRLLQYLVFHELMPARAHPDSARHALLSRQWYSTLRDLDGVSLLPLPFFPVGVLAPTSRKTVLRAIDRAVRDECGHLYRLIRRLHAAAVVRGSQKHATRLHQWLTSELLARHATSCLTQGEREEIEKRQKEILARPELLRQKLVDLRKLSNGLANFILGPESFLFGKAAVWKSSVKRGKAAEIEDCWLPAAMSLDLRDARQLLRWHRVRLAMLVAQWNQTSLGEAVSKAVGDALDGAATGVGKLGFRRVTALTGYACSGSWLVGVHKTAHSPQLSWKLIEEITSAHSARDRGRAGAGIPTRKDFFSYHGDDQVPGLPNPMSWDTLFLCAAAKARRRDRAVPPDVSVSELSAVVHRQVLHCLTLADMERQKGSGANVSTLTEAARRAVFAVLDHVRKKTPPAQSGGPRVGSPKQRPSK